MATPVCAHPAPAHFTVGEIVYVADPAAADHTRLPGFLRNKKGMVTEVYPGAFEYFVSTGPDGLSGRSMCTASRLTRQTFGAQTRASPTPSFMPICSRPT